MNIIINEYKIDGQKLVIEHDIAKDEFYFRVIHPATFTTIYHSEPISNLIAARAKGFQFLGVLV